MSEHDKLTVVLIVSTTLGALADRIMALSMIAGVILLWTLQNSHRSASTSVSCSRLRGAALG
jgi:hypothetical protein